MGIGFVSIFVVGFLAIWNPSQEGSLRVLAEQVVEHAVATWPGKTVAISEVAGDPAHRELWASQVRFLAGARGMEMISPSTGPGCSGAFGAFPDAECYFPRPRDYVVVEFIKVEAVGPELRLTYRAHVQGDPAAGFVTANLRAEFDQNAAGEWLLRGVTAPVE